VFNDAGKRDEKNCVKVSKERIVAGRWVQGQKINPKLWKSSLIIFYLRNMCFTVAPVRHKICVLYVEKSTCYLDLKCAITLENKITCVLN
jgi:hypothetical protein